MIEHNRDGFDRPLANACGFTELLERRLGVSEEEMNRRPDHSRPGDLLQSGNFFIVRRAGQIVYDAAILRNVGRSMFQDVPNETSRVAGEARFRNTCW